MNPGNKINLKSDKTTDFSFYVMVIALAAGFIITLGYVVYSLFV
ncbi:hypothetical protein ASZ90_004365 [hydrocarbon metagenome]|uniref:Uncharacterized protein n=1 Tax=hydrocarbon metagenome TaxID=938273 RepID=A0A0W8FY46_9ZZZZ